MARPLRVQYAGAYYHVMNRGNSRQDIFFEDEDKRIFLSALTDSCDLHGVRLIAYVLMPNHFHLIVQTEKPNLSEFMRHFLVTYTVRINRKWGRTGHVFQGRYKSLIIDEESYLLPLTRYIHLNPIRSEELAQSDGRARIQYLKKYRWSSLAGYCFAREKIRGADYRWLLEAYFGGAGENGRRRYWRYICQGVEGGGENPFARVVHQAILGAEEFVEKVKDRIARGKEREVPALRGLRRSLPVERILEVVGSSAGVKAEQILDRHSKAKEARQMAMDMCYRHCSVNQRKIGELFGVDYSTVSQTRGRLKRKLQKDKQARARFEEIERRIANLSK